MHSIYEILDLIAAAHRFYDYRDVRKFESEAEKIEGMRIAFVGSVSRISSHPNFELENQLDSAHLKTLGLDIGLYTFDRLPDETKVGDVVLITARIGGTVIHGGGHYSISIDDVKLAALNADSQTAETIATYEIENGSAVSCLLETIEGQRNLVEQKVGSILSTVARSNGKFTFAKSCKAGGVVEYTHIQNGELGQTPTVTSVLTRY